MKFRLAALVALTVASGLAAAQQFKPAEQIKYRQSAMQVFQRHAGILSAMSKGDVAYNKESAQASAEIINLLARHVGSGFGPGTENGAPTRADMKVWSDTAGFKAANDKFVAATGKLVAASGDANAMKSALGDVGQACKGCHDDFRMKDPRG